MGILDPGRNTEKLNIGINKMYYSIVTTLADVAYITHFTSEEVKQDYINEENHFCKEQLNDFHSALNMKARESARAEVAKKRLAFCRIKGYKARTQGKPRDFYLDQDESIEDILA